MISDSDYSKGADSEVWKVIPGRKVAHAMRERWDGKLSGICAQTSAYQLVQLRDPNAAERRCDLCLAAIKRDLEKTKTRSRINR